MGNKKQSGRTNTDADEAPTKAAAKAFVLKVPTHCRCDGCGDKIRAAVKGLARRCDGIVSLDQSALGTKGELSVVATADPERLRRRLRKATGKSVGLVFPKPPPAASAEGGGGKDAAATVQALLAALQLQQQVAASALHHGQPMPAVAWNGYGQAAYPWVVQQAPPPEPYPYLAASYPAASWGAYPHDGGLGGGGGWLGY